MNPRHEKQPPVERNRTSMWLRGPLLAVLAALSAPSALGQDTNDHRNPEKEHRPRGFFFSSRSDTGIVYKIVIFSDRNGNKTIDDGELETINGVEMVHNYFAKHPEWLPSENYILTESGVFYWARIRQNAAEKINSL